MKAGLLNTGDRPLRAVGAGTWIGVVVEGASSRSSLPPPLPPLPLPLLLPLCPSERVGLHVSGWACAQAS